MRNDVLMAERKMEIEWLTAPRERNYPAAQSYLSLIYDEKMAKDYVEALRRAPLSEYKAKDIFRASGLPLLGLSNDHVEKDKQKIKNGQALSPLLLVRDPAHGRVVIADGYHRLCAVYSFDEDAVIPCQIVSAQRP